MNKEVKDFAVQKTKELMEAGSCSREAKAAAQAWLDALGTEHEAQETEKYIKELEGDIMPIDLLIAFAPTAKKSRRREPNTATARPARPWRRFWRRKRSC